MKYASDLWYGEESDNVLWHIVWDGESCTKLFEKTDYFLEEYLKLTLKYQILVPAPLYYKNELGIDDLIEDYIIPFTNELEERGNLANLFFVPIFMLYNLSKLKPFMWDMGQEVFPSELFIFDEEGNIMQKTITDVIALRDVRESDPRGTPPVRLNSTMAEQHFALHLAIESDCFFPALHGNNRKIQTIRERSGSLNPSITDNSELSYLNTPRLNSFLRDLLSLSRELGAAMTFENFVEPNPETPVFVNSNGVLIHNEVIYYEDVKEMLEPEYRL